MTSHHHPLSFCCEYLRASRESCQCWLLSAKKNGNNALVLQVSAVFVQTMHSLRVKHTCPHVCQGNIPKTEPCSLMPPHLSSCVQMQTFSPLLLAHKWLPPLHMFEPTRFRIALSLSPPQMLAFAGKRTSRSSLLHPSCPLSCQQACAYKTTSFYSLLVLELPLNTQAFTPLTKGGWGVGHMGFSSPSASVLSRSGVLPSPSEWMWDSGRREDERSVLLL